MYDTLISKKNTLVCFYLYINFIFINISYGILTSEDKRNASQGKRAHLDCSINLTYYLS